MNPENKEMPQWQWPEIEGFKWTTNSDGWPNNKTMGDAGTEFETEPLPFSAEALQRLYAKLWNVPTEDVKVIELAEYMRMPPDIKFGIYKKE
ncbi:MAG: hypothetical protein HW383_700 [Candidatus Magasanikbacteria bacterium]|nr:hypothetical protein [Candidatus Magasanikbacteria bacterium]